MKLIISGTLPTMNEIIAAAKSHPIAYRDMKRTYTELVAWEAKAQKIKPFTAADFTFTWICRDKRSDKDNIIAGEKFAFDGLKEAGCMANDGWSQVGEITHKFGVDRKHPRVEIEITEVGYEHTGIIPTRNRRSQIRPTQRSHPHLAGDAAIDQPSHGKGC